MTRYSSDDVDAGGVVRNGYDYFAQAWVKDYIIEQCGHSVIMDGCTACQWHGEDIRNFPGRRAIDSQSRVFQMMRAMMMQWRHRSAVEAEPLDQNERQVSDRGDSGR